MPKKRASRGPATPDMPAPLGLPPDLAKALQATTEIVAVVASLDPQESVLAWFAQEEQEVVGAFLDGDLEKFREARLAPLRKHHIHERCLRVAQDAVRPVHRELILAHGKVYPQEPLFWLGLEFHEELGMVGGTAGDCVHAAALNLARRVIALRRTVLDLELRGLEMLLESDRESQEHWREARQHQAESLRGEATKRHRELAKLCSIDPALIVSNLNLEAVAAAEVRRESKHPKKRRRRIDAELTTRQSEVLHLYMDGKTLPEVARLLCLDRATVEEHLQVALRKCGLSIKKLMRPGTTPLPADYRGQSIIAGEDEGPAPGLRSRVVKDRRRA